jgi:2,5-diketo-D-gluconate reductase A
VDGDGRQERQTFRLNATTEITGVGFGTYLVSPEDAPGVIEEAIRAGYRHIDTASGYSNEEAVGEGIRAGLAATGLERADIFVTTKLWPGNPAWGQEPRRTAARPGPSSTGACRFLASTTSTST